MVLLGEKWCEEPTAVVHGGRQTVTALAYITSPIISYNNEQ